MTVDVEPEPGQKWVRLNVSYEILDVEDSVVTMRDCRYKRTVEETVERFRDEVEAGRAVHHPQCENCGLPIDPDEKRPGPLHYDCWFETATVHERCEAETARPGGNMMAAEALRSDDPRAHLLSVIGNPARTFHDRTDAENLLAGAVSTRELIEASVRCPNCREGEAFEMDPQTGAVRCHCGELLKQAET